MMRALFEQLSLFATAAAPAEQRLSPAAPTQPPRQRYLKLGSQLVAYQLRRRSRRSLSMSIDERGLRISAPLRVNLAEIEAFAASHAEWALKKLADVERGRLQRNLTVRDGCCLPLLGNEISVRIVSGANRSRWLDEENPAALQLEARVGADCELLARRALQRRAIQVFTERVSLYAGKLGRASPPISLSSARTRWGCCSRTGIRLNWRLIHMPLTIIDYVVAHELAHLIEMNHSPRFWSVVETLYPEWRSARRELKTRALALPQI